MPFGSDPINSNAEIFKQRHFDTDENSPDEGFVRYFDSLSRTNAGAAWINSVLEFDTKYIDGKLMFPDGTPIDDPGIFDPLDKFKQLKLALGPEGEPAHAINGSMYFPPDFPLKTEYPNGERRATFPNGELINPEGVIMHEGTHALFSYDKQLPDVGGGWAREIQSVRAESEVRTELGDPPREFLHGERAGLGDFTVHVPLGPSEPVTYYHGVVGYAAELANDQYAPGDIVERTRFTIVGFARPVNASELNPEGFPSLNSEPAPGYPLSNPSPIIGTPLVPTPQINPDSGMDIMRDMMRIFSPPAYRPCLDGCARTGGVRN